MQKLFMIKDIAFMTSPVSTLPTVLVPSKSSISSSESWFFGDALRRPVSRLGKTKANLGPVGAVAPVSPVAIPFKEVFKGRFKVG